MCIVHSAYLKKSSVTKRILISNIFKLIIVLLYLHRNSSLVLYKEGLYVDETFFCVYVSFQLKKSKNMIFFFRPFSSDFADKMTIITKTKKNSWSQLCLYLLGHT